MLNTEGPFEGWEQRFELGPLLERFVQDFDDGKYPELVEVVDDH